MKNFIIKSNDRIIFLKNISFPILFIVMIAIAKIASGQGMYVAPNANMFVHGNSLGIFTNVKNDGNIGSKPGAVIKFMGLLWVNDSLATMPDENSYKKGSSVPVDFTGKGGLFWFNNFSKSANQPQLISGGYNVANHSGASFPNLQVDNENGIFLSGTTDAEVRNTMNFKNGKFWVNGNNLQVGVSDPGVITGYADTKYVVTGTTAEDGFLYRAKLSEATGEVIFPVGADAVYYTPAIVLYKGTAQNFRVRPFNLLNSAALQNSNKDSSLLLTTWNIGKDTKEIGEMNVYLDNPAALDRATGVAYVSHYDKNFAAWDTIKTSELITAKFYTIHNAGHSKILNGRKFVKSFEQNEYFSKSGNSMLSVPEKLTLNSTATSAEMQTDKSFNADVTIVAENNGLISLNNIAVTNDLSKTLGSLSFKIVSLSATGTLLPNLHYDGLTGGDTVLLLPASSLQAMHTDTIHLLVNIQNTNNVAAACYNHSFATAQSVLTGNYVRTNALAIVHVNAAEWQPSVVVMNNPTSINRLSLMSDENFKKLKWQLVDHNGKVFESGEFSEIVKGTINTAITPNMSSGIYFITLKGDGKVLQTQKWIKL